MSRKEFRELAPPQRAHDIINSFDITTEPEEVPLQAAHHRVLATRVDASIDVPGFDRSTMDGYAVKGRDTAGADETDPVTLHLVGTVHAGEEPNASIDHGEATEISTGAVLPRGADAVVMVERTERTTDTVEVRAPVAPGDNVMFAGADIAAGARALNPGTLLTAREIGLLSALGHDDVTVRGNPVIGILSTGDELVRPGESLRHAAGEIHDVNSYTLATAVHEAGGDPIVYPHAGDEYDEMERLLHQAADECNLVLSSGSTSAGAVDVIHRVIEERGELLLHGVAVKPGKPMLLGRIGPAPYVGLPGYPVSALTIFRTFIAPAIRRAAGRPETRTETLTGRMAVREYYAEGRLRFMPVGLIEEADRTLLVYPTDKGSGATTSLVEADGFVEVPPEREQLAVGDKVDVRLFSPDVHPPLLLGVGEADPVLSRVLDDVDRPRYLPVGTREGMRRLRNNLPDFAALAGSPGHDTDAVEVAAWTRSWGLIVPRGNPHSVTGLADLIDRDLTFVNRDRGSGLHQSLRTALSTLAEDRGEPERTLIEAIDGFELSVKGLESPARKVAEGSIDVGLGLETTTTDTLDLGFVPVGDQRIRILVHPDRRTKPGIQSLESALAHVDSMLSDYAGYTP